MPVTVQQPGVYIEELAGLALSINSSATAVPVFASSHAAFNKNFAGTKDNLLASKRIDSWLEFTELMKTIENKGADPAQFKFDPTDKLHLSMRTYFENGGGYCYIVALDNLEKEVPKLDDVTLVVAAGAELAKFRAAAANLCKLGSTRFAIFDGSDGAASLEEASKLSAKYDENAYAAVYYPWLNAAWAGTNPIPPSAAVAGAYCTVDRERGVWKAPANIELKGGVVPAVNLSDEDQSQYMTGRPINMIRRFRGGGATIWGARTLKDSDDWRYIPVRRLFNTAERDIKKAMSVAMFEPNSQPTWERVRAAVDNYLHGIWKQGGLMGNTAKEAYFVQIGQGLTMTETDIEQGKMIVKIGLAAVRPAEFIVLQFTQEMAQG